MRRLIFLAAVSFALPLAAQTTRPVTVEDPAQAIAALRAELIDSFNKGDVNRLLSHLDPDVVIIWQNGEVCRGPEQVRVYYDKMMTGPNRVVASVHADPQVLDRHVYGDWAVSWGLMNDHFTLTDGRGLDMNSKFTATIDRRGDEWKVASFHLSVNAFDNAILRMAERRSITYTAIVAGVVALALGVLVGRFTRRKKV